MLTLVLAPPPGAAAELPVRTAGDLRSAIYASERVARDGEITREEGLRLRLRLGAEAALDEDWLVRGRLATRLTTDQDRFRFWLKGYAPTRTGLEDGDATIDEFFLRWAPAGADWSLRIGRFQSSFTLPDVFGKTLDRKDSANVAITWTDGLHWRYAFSPAWQSHLLLQHNPRGGSGSTARAPLSFDDHKSRVSAFAGLESRAHLGPVTQRMVAVSWLPGALATEGLAAARREDYLAFTARGAAEWPVGAEGMRVLLGAEFGYAPNTPEKVVMNAGDGGLAGGRAAQVSFNLLGIRPRHDLGIVYGRLDPGWLISPNYRPNDDMWEIRYRWQVQPRWLLEVRLRRREERELPADAGRPRVDDDFYLRLTGRY